MKCERGHNSLENDMIPETNQHEAVSVESTALLGLLADIRSAVGDPDGKLMQDELVAHCRNIRDLLARADDALHDMGLGKHGSPLRCEISHALSVGRPNTKMRDGESGPTTPTNTP